MTKTKLQQKRRRLPKQWKDWVRQAGLRTPGPAYMSRRPWAWFSLRGKGRVWRVNDAWELQCGDAYKDFERWGLCDIRSCKMPSTKAEFLQAVQTLLREHNAPSKQPPPKGGGFLQV